MTNRYRSDTVYKDAVLKYYVIGWFGGLGVVAVTAVAIIAMYEPSCWAGYRLALVALPAVHITTWLIIANLMCATFQAMTRTAGSARRQAPAAGVNREIPIVKRDKRGNVTWEDE